MSGGVRGTADRQDLDVMISTRHACWPLVVPARDHIGAILQQGHPYEEELLDALSSLVSRDQVVLDVGANVGNHTIYLGIVCRAVVHAYEPNPRALTYLRRNVALNRLEHRVHVHEKAASDSPGYGTVRNPREREFDMGSAYVETTSAGPVRTLRLDDVEHGVVRLVKIDVEGGEHAVIRGAVETLARYKPVVVAEAWNEAARQATDALLAPLGYRRFPMSFAITPTHVYLARRHDFVRLLLSHVILRRVVVHFARRLRVLAGPRAFLGS
jgi:FkbM family methyltransferase